MIEPRLYRATLFPALLALIVAAFSLEDRPAPLPQALAADVLFQGRTATAGAEQIARTRPDRRPGSVGDRATGLQVAQSFVQSGFTTVLDRFKGDDGKPLLNVIGRRAGATRRQIVVVAARDAGSVPDATGSAADTAALSELARVLQGTPSRKTIVLASVDGSTLGEVGVHRLLAKLPNRDKVDAVLVLSDLAAPGPKVPPLLPWSNGSERTGVPLERTASSSESQEFGREPDASGFFAQMIRMAFPVGVGGQGPLLEGGLDTVRFAGSGELPPPRGERGIESLDADRVGSLGRSVLRTVFAIDPSGRRLGGKPRSYVTVGQKVLPEWSIALLGIALILPALIVSIDGFARARRRHEPVGRWGRWVLASSLALVLGLVLAKLTVVAGIVANPPESPIPPELRPPHGGDVILMAVIAAIVAVTWWGAGRVVLRGRGGRLDLAAPGAGCAVGLTLSFLVFAIWFVNPYAALLLTPALHLWLIASMTDVPARGPLPVALLAVGVLPLVAVVLYYMSRLSMNPVEALWYLYLLVTSGAVGVAAALLSCVFVGVSACLIAVMVARARRPPSARVEEPQQPTVFGPGGYAGPGSLGGTESALRR